MNTVLLALLLSAPTSFAYSSGRTGASTSGCGGCHDAASTTTSSFVVPSLTVAPGDVVPVQLLVSSTVSTRQWAGLDVSATGGTLAAGSNTRASSGEITHSRAVAAVSGITTFDFSWTAPSSPGTYTLRGVGNAVNDNGSDSGDGWALASSVVITVADSTSGGGGVDTGRGGGSDTGGGGGSDTGGGGSDTGSAGGDSGGGDTGCAGGDSGVGSDSGSAGGSDSGDGCGDEDDPDDDDDDDDGEGHHGGHGGSHGSGDHDGDCGDEDADEDDDREDGDVDSGGSGEDGGDAGHGGGRSAHRIEARPAQASLLGGCDSTGGAGLGGIGVILAAAASRRRR